LNRASLTVLAALVVLAAIVAGCGGGDDSDSDTSDSLTKAEFIKQGDAVCEKANEQSEAEAEKFAKENDFSLERPTKAQLEEAVTEILVPNFNRQVDELKALGAPEGDEEQVEEIVSSLKTAADEIKGDPSLVFEGKVLKEPAQLAEDYGFKVCGKE
jgi:hypothetical protein